MKKETKKEKIKNHDSISNKIKEKIYAYVDESGQDTKGLIFVVSILVFETEKNDILAALEEAEKESRKKNIKWNKSKHEFRKAYIEKISNMEILKGKIFFDIFSDTKKYIELTSYATAKAVLRKSDGDYKATIFVDGLKKKEIEKFIKGLRDLKIRTKKVQGVKKDENNAFIRLVDSVCGLVRDANEENKWAIKMVEKMKKKKIAKEL
jgi:hypothetical protein